EHMPDIEITAIQHDLNAVGTAALIAVGDMFDAPARNALRRNRRLRRGLGADREWNRRGSRGHACKRGASRQHLYLSLIGSLVKPECRVGGQGRKTNPPRRFAPEPCGHEGKSYSQSQSSASSGWHAA